MIRSANLEDVPWLLEQLRQFDHFFGTKKSLFPEDPKTAAGIIEGLIANQPFFISADEQDRYGFIAGAVARHPYNPDILVLSELFWWVGPEYRGTTVGARLLKHFMCYGFEADVDWIILTIENGTPIDPASLERAGFKLHERSFLLEVGT